MQNSRILFNEDAGISYKMITPGIIDEDEEAINSDIAFENDKSMGRARSGSNGS